MLAEHAAGGEIVHEIGRVVLDHRDLLQHHLALGLERLGLEAGPRGHVAHDVERERQVLVHHAHVNDRRLARRERVQLGAQAIRDWAISTWSKRSLPLNSRCSMRCVTPASGGRSSRAHADPDADGDRAHGVIGLGDDTKAVGKGCLVVHGPEPT